MNQDLPFPDGDPGLDQLFRTLTSGPTRAELTGQDDALAMFRANITPAPAVHPAAVPPNGVPPNGVPRRRRRIRVPFRPGLGLAAATVVALAGGVTAAAYADALPTPVQHAVHDVFKFAGVPDKQHHRTGTSGRRGHHSAGRRAGHPGAAPSQQPSGRPAPTRSHKPGASPSASQSPAASSSPSPAPSSSPTGTATLAVSVSSTQVSAGAPVVVDGELTRSGSGVQGVTIVLLEHQVGTPGWHKAGSGQTNTSGNVAVTVSALTTNAAFRLAAGGGVHSAAVHVVVIPVVTIALKEGVSGLRDLLKVSTQYGRPRNWVVLQADEAGVWTSLREKRLNAAGKTHFYLSGKHLKGDLVQVVLLATVRHGAATSNQVTVPSPT
jgi:hypothetical protein